MMYAWEKEKGRTIQYVCGMVAAIILPFLVVSGCGANENDAADMNDSEQVAGAAI